MSKKLLVCTFSGGRTSVFMGLMLKEHPKYKDFNKIYIFANTGKELPETLDFINKCDKKWDLDVVWLEVDVQYKKGVGTTFKIVDFNSASRNGEPFETMLKKYTLPNNMASNCTRENAKKDNIIYPLIDDLKVDSSEAIPRFDLRTNVSIEQLIKMAKQPFTKAHDLHELNYLFDFETDCFCKFS